MTTKALLYFLALVSLLAVLVARSERTRDIEPGPGASTASFTRSTVVAPASVPTGAPPAARAEAESAFGFDPARFYTFADGESLNPSAVAVGDVSGDGRQDLVLVMLSSHAVADQYGRDRKMMVFRQQPDGTLADPVMYPFTDGLYERADNYIRAGLTLADLNHDGTKDIVVGYGKGIAIFTSTGGGGLAYGRHLIDARYRNLDPFLGTHAVENVVVLDVDRDGHQDVVAHNGYTGATVFFGNRDGRMEASVHLDTQAGGITDVKAGDVTGDGQPDLVVLAGGRQSRRFWVLPNIGARGFGAPVLHSLVPDQLFSSLAIGDWNADGRNEIAVSLYANTTYSIEQDGELLIFERQAGAAHVLDRRFATYDLPSALTTTDLDRDGWDDLVLDHRGWEHIGHYLGGNRLGTEVLSFTEFYASTADNNAGLAAGDINGDGCGDVVLADTNFGVIFLYGKGCNALPLMIGSCGLMQVEPAGSEKGHLRSDATSPVVPALIAPRSAPMAGHSSLVPRASRPAAHRPSRREPVR